MQISFFGRLADLYGQRSFDSAPDDLHDGLALRDWLSVTQPAMADILAQPGTRLVINDEIVDWETALSVRDDIAIIPIVSGG